MDTTDIRVIRLNEAFRASGLNQTELCERTGINKGALSSYLSGRYFPKQKSLELLSNALHVSINYLMGHDEPSSSLSDQSASIADITEARLLAVYRDLNNAGKDKLLSYAEDLQASGRYKKESDSGKKAI